MSDFKPHIIETTGLPEDRIYVIGRPRQTISDAEGNPQPEPFEDWVRAAVVVINLEATKETTP